MTDQAQTPNPTMAALQSALEKQPAGGAPVSPEAPAVDPGAAQAAEMEHIREQQAASDAQSAEQAAKLAAQIHEQIPSDQPTAQPEAAAQPVSTGDSHGNDILQLTRQKI